MQAEQQDTTHEIDPAVGPAESRNASTAAIKKLTEDDNINSGSESDSDINVWSEGYGGTRSSFLSTVYAMLDASVSTYILSFLRGLKRQGVANYIPDSILQMPLKPEEIFHSILECEEKGVIKSLNTKIFLEFFSFQIIRERYGRKPAGSGSTERDGNTLSMVASTSGSTILSFDDLNQEKELVYSITINHQEKYVVVAFRGSTTLEDWRADLNPAMKVMENPVHEIREDIPTIQIHAGFYEYLHKRQPPVPQLTKTNEPTTPVSLRQLLTPTLKLIVGEKNTDESPTKCQIILEQVAEVFRDYPEYAFYTTGHSLGGALATLFAFEVACLKNPEIPNLITCINFASPKVGNVHFCRTIEHLEETGVIRHVRVTNYYDAVPRVPVRAHMNDFCLLCRMKNTYTHVGYKARLKSGRKLRVVHAPKFETQREFLSFISKTFVSLCFHAIHLFTVGNMDLLRYHSCLDYYELICEAKEQLQEQDLDKMYSKSSNK